METKRIENELDALVARGEIPNGVLIINKDNRQILKKCVGYCDIQTKDKVDENSVFRMMSMTKPVVAVGILKLIDEGKLGLDDDITHFIPEFDSMRVIDDKRFEFKENMNPLGLLYKLIFFDKIKPKTVEKNRNVTIRDLLSHSSGIEQGVWGTIAFLRNKEKRNLTTDLTDHYKNYYLDFQPGTGTGYSPLAGFDILLRIIEIVSGKNGEEYFQTEIFEPLSMNSSTFFYKEKNKVKLYEHKKNGLKDVTDTKKDVKGFVKMTDNYTCGSGGLYSTASDYNKFALMLLNDGKIGDKQFLSKEIVDKMHTESPKIHLEPEKGQVWGLGVRIRQDNTKGDFNATNGTYGWSGAFGTHFFVSPEDCLTAVFLTNVSNAGGSSYGVSRKIEKMIFEEIRK